MEPDLKGRHMISASARRKRLQEHQQEHRLTPGRIYERKRQIMTHKQITSVTPGAEQFESAGLDRQSSTDTASECSVKTPDETSPPTIFTSIYGGDDECEVVSSPDGLQILVDHNITKKAHFHDVALPSPKPRMLSTLTKISDFSYDRFSMFIDDSFQLPKEEDSEDESCLEGIDEMASPLETAVSVSYSKTHARPSLILVHSFDSKSKARVVSTQSRRSTATLRAGLPSSAINADLSMFSGFLASEAKEFELTDPASSSEDLLCRVDSVSPPSNDVKDDYFRLGTQPIPHPTIASRRNHRRIDSLKSLITSVPVHRPSPPPSRPLSRAGTISDILDSGVVTQSPISTSRPGTSQSRRGSIGNLLASVKTARRVPSQSSVTALPVPPSPSPSQLSLFINGQESQQVDPQPNRKKSFNLLRRRSESIGQAFKSLSSSKSRLSIRPDVPALPTSIPTTPSSYGPSTPSSQLSMDVGKASASSMKSVDLGRMPLPGEVTKSGPSKRSMDLGYLLRETAVSTAPPSPRPTTRSGRAYNAFPAPTERSISGSSIGLGLKRVEGISSFR